jgi:hypothetical protein
VHAEQWQAPAMLRLALFSRATGEGRGAGNCSWMLPASALTARVAVVGAVGAGLSERTASHGGVVHESARRAGLPARKLTTAVDEGVVSRLQVGLSKT